MRYRIDEYTDCSTVDIYLDPETRTVYSYPSSGSDLPGDAAHSRHLLLGSVPPDTVAEVLQDFLRGMEPTLVALCNSYRGTRWDGNDLVGIWEDDAVGIQDALAEEFTEGRCPAVAYWDAGQAFEDTDDEDKARWLDMPTSEAVADMVAYMKDLGAYVRPEDCERLLKEWADDQPPSVLCW